MNAKAVRFILAIVAGTVSLIASLFLSVSFTEVSLTQRLRGTNHRDLQRKRINMAPPNEKTEPN